MNLEYFNQSYDKFWKLLKSSSFPDISKQAFSCYYHKFADFRGEVFIIIKRVESESIDFDKYANDILKKMVQMGEMDKNTFDSIPKELLINSFISLKLDIKDLYIHSKIFIDSLSEIISISCSEKGRQLPRYMTDLLKKIKNGKISGEFFGGLLNKMEWYDKFTEKRDRIIHNLEPHNQQFFFTNTLDGRIGILEPEKGKALIKSVEGFIEETLLNLKELLDYLIQYKIYQKLTVSNQ